MGARPMARVIQDEIKQVLADELLFGGLTNGGHVKIDVSKKKLVCKVESIKAEKASV
jgi:ATP-dependent Clp protease ATP-binding subunit ClpA